MRRESPGRFASTSGSESCTGASTTSGRKRPRYSSGNAAGGTGGPLEAGTRGNAGPPVPIGKDFSGLFSAGALGATKVMRAIEPSRVGSVSIRGGETSRLVGGGAGDLAAGGG